MYKTSNKKLFNRISILDKLHKIDDKQIDSFVNAINFDEFHSNIQIADLFCGEGFASTVFLDKLKEKNMVTKVHLIDNYKNLLQRAKEKLMKMSEGYNFEFHEHKKDLNKAQLPFEDGFIDLILVKMGFHELSILKQEKLISECFRVIKPGGKLLIWGDHIRKNDNNEDLIGFNQIIRAKDELSGFQLQVKNRYFTSKEEIILLLKKSGFTVTPIFEWLRRWDSLKRFETELELSEEKLDKLNSVIDKQFFSDNLREKFKFKKTVNDNDQQGRSFNIYSGILLANKPGRL